MIPSKEDEDVICDSFVFGWKFFFDDFVGRFWGFGGD